MEMKRLTGGSLRAAGYDERARKLVIELTSGTFEYQSVPSECGAGSSGARRRGAISATTSTRNTPREAAALSGSARAAHTARRGTASPRRDREERGRRSCAAATRYWIVSLRPARRASSRA